MKGGDFRISVVLPLIILSVGCGRTAGRSSKAVRYDPWVLACSDPNDPTSAYLTNGLLGVRIGRDGTGTKDPLLIGWPGGYDGKDNIIPFPDPLQAKWTGFDPKSSRDYSQTLNMRTGVLCTRWSQEGYEIESQTVLDPQRPVIAQRWDITTKERIALKMKESEFHVQPAVGESTSDVRIFRETLRPTIALATALHVPHVKGFICDGLNLNGTAPSNRQITVEQVWDFETDPNSPVQNLTFEGVRNRSSKKWADRWRTDIEIDGPPEDQQAVHSWLFYLRACLDAQEWPDLNPMGLSSDLYKGHVFWDADIWMFPALAFVDPDAAKSIATYRLERALHFAKPNVAGPDRLGSDTSNRVEFPWESADSGEELAPPAFRDEIHITGDVAFMLYQAAALGFVPATSADKLVGEAANYYLSRATNGGRYLHLNKVKGPDEYHLGDDDLYTNAIAQWLFDRSRKQAAKVGFFLPHDSESLVEFPNDPVRAYGQADAILTVYPLQDPTAESEAATMMSRFPAKTQASSPAMSDSISALIFARMGNTDTAYATWRHSWQDYSNYPLQLFSELRGKNRTYFQTGAAGCLQTVLYGFVGFRIDWRKSANAAWEKGLNEDETLTVEPHLPSQWKKVVLRNFTVLGTRYTLTVTRRGITLNQGEP